MNQFIMAFVPAPRKHNAGATVCTACVKPYPIKCECGGLRHGEIVEMMLVIECDICHFKHSELKKDEHP